MPGDFNNLGKLAQQVRQGAARARKNTVDEVAQLARDRYHDPKHGHMRVHSDGSGVYIASARGEAPARDSGDLEKHTLAEEIDDETSAVVADTDYAEELEEERDRPILTPLVNDAKIALFQHVADELSQTG